MNHQWINVKKYFSYEKIWQSTKTTITITSSIFTIIAVMFVPGFVEIFKISEIEGEWLMYGGNLQATHQVKPGSGLRTNDLKLLWKYKLSGSSIVSDGNFDVLAHNNKIFAIVREHNNDSKLMAFNASDGGKEWESECFDGIKSTPIIQNNKIYLLTDKIVHILDEATGTTLKSFYINHFIRNNEQLGDNSYFESIIIDDNNDIYIAMNISCLTAVVRITEDLFDKKQVNFNEVRLFEEFGMCETNLTIIENFLFFSRTNDDHIIISKIDLINRNRKVDEYMTAGDEATTIIPINRNNFNGIPPIGSYNDSINLISIIDDKLHCLSSRFMVDTSEPMQLECDGVPIVKPSYAQKKILIPLNNGMYCYKSDSLTKIWEYKWDAKLGEFLAPMNTPIVSEDKVIYTNNRGIISLDIETGKLLWSINLARFENIDGLPSIFSPVIYNHKIYIIGRNHLYCFGDSRTYNP